MEGGEGRVVEVSCGGFCFIFGGLFVVVARHFDCVCLCLCLIRW